ncbi:MAG: hypothetical protein HGA87_01105 [Desulfobulbaceae bacterium]|nr:hypothetical protein [Desulfobulbaceae bacterium]
MIHGMDLATVEPDWKSMYQKQIGCTLRDQFAMAALTGLIASDAEIIRTDYERTADLLANCSYEIADAMLISREGR